MHPIIISELERRIRNENGLIFCEVPLLFEGNLQEKFDYVLIVLRPLPLRVDSIVERDGITNEDALKRIKNQFDYDKLNDFPQNYAVIENKEGVKELKIQVQNLIEKLLVKHEL